MKYWRTYFDRYATKEALITTPPSSDLGMVIVIPAFKEPNVLATLTSISRCSPPACDVEVLVIINEPEGISNAIRELHLQTAREINQWSSKVNTSARSFYVHHHPPIPAKRHGVGLARKIGMDEAARRLQQIGHHQGIIAAFDADSTCSANYLQELHHMFASHPLAPGASIYFEHPLDQTPAAMRSGIIAYELHLRYFLHALRWAGLNVFHTVGSSMVVRADAYVKQGGMNTRKAGEDFYFLNRIIRMGGFREITTCTVYPSARVSDRVPFGTGRAMSQLTNQERNTYNPASFRLLRDLMRCSVLRLPYDDLVNHLDPICREFLTSYRERYVKILEETKSASSFRKAFDALFDPFFAMKFLHYTRDTFPDIPVSVAAAQLLEAFGRSPAKTGEQLLVQYRERDREL